MSKKERDIILFIEDVLDAVQKIERYTNNLTLKAFRNDEMAIDAVIRNFEVIGEATNKIPEDFRAQYPDVEWREAISFRNVLIHDYFGIDVEAVWDTIQNNLPLLKKHISGILKDLEG